MSDCTIRGRVPSLFGGVGDDAVCSDADSIDVLRDSVDSTHDTLIVSFKEHSHSRKDIDKSQELIARQMFPQCYAHDVESWGIEIWRSGIESGGLSTPDQILQSPIRRRCPWKKSPRVPPGTPPDFPQVGRNVLERYCGGGGSASRGAKT